jgi:aspartyl-tRNA(Asn)/glutamyl-tRNA(Gln) amidotransferase subunit C
MRQIIIKGCSMKIDDTVLAKLEKLSHLRIDEDKKAAVQEQLSGILDYIENLNELNTDRLSNTFSTLQGGTPLREDLPRDKQTVALDILSHAPKVQDDFFIVPSIIE